MKTINGAFDLVEREAFSEAKLKHEVGENGGNDFKVILSTGKLFESYIDILYGKEITAEQRFRLCDCMREILLEVKDNQPHIEWEKTKIIPFKVIRGGKK